jgi:hypothetical protein
MKSKRVHESRLFSYNLRSSKLVIELAGCARLASVLDGGNMVLPPWLVSVP